MQTIIKNAISSIVQEKRRKKLKKYGDDVVIPSKCELQGNIECGSHIRFGRGGYNGFYES